jgi:hypothetical protein
MVCDRYPMVSKPDEEESQPTCAARAAAADLVSSATLQEGDTLIVQLNGTGLVAMRGLSEVDAGACPIGNLRI